MAPPDVQLAYGQGGEHARPGNSPQQRGNREVGHRAEEAVQQYRRIGRKHRVIEIRAAPVVMGAQMQREPKMLRNVIKERRCKITGDERDDESGKKRYSGGNGVV
jgi:hypothetical protein